MKEATGAKRGCKLEPRTNSSVSGVSRLALMTAFMVGASMFSAPIAVGQDGDSGWFTEEQAARGNAVFTTECGGCHGYTLAEVLAEAETAEKFYSFIANNMPWENPGALPRQQYADIVAFFLDELGFPAGAKELPPDRELMAQIVPADVPETAAQAEPGDMPPAEAGETSQNEPEEPAVNSSVATSEVGESEDVAGEGEPGDQNGTYFTAEQAEKGKRDFAISCGGCHGADMVGIFQTYGTAAEYYRFISSAMPADDPGNLAPQTYIAVIAYLLSESGFPAGDAELTNDMELLKQIVPGEASGN